MISLATTQYIGSRYVPLFGDPIEWSAEKAYEPLTVVTHLGNSYTSKQAVPVGIDIGNEDFWVVTGNYNAQVELYRQEVLRFDNRITGNANTIDTEIQNRITADDILTNRIDAEIQERETADKTIIDVVNTESNNRIAADDILTNSINAETQKRTTAVAESNARDIIAIGDSYGQGYTPDGNVTSWISHISKRLSQYGINTYSSAIGGYGFTTGDFATLLTDVINKLSDSQKKSVKTVVFGGGYNDRNASATSIQNGMESCRDIIKSNLPNVQRILIAPFGMCVEGLTTGVHATTTYQQMTDMHTHYIQANAASGLGSILSGSNMLLRRNSYFSSDYVHPNNNGQFLLGSFIYNAIMGNSDGSYAKIYNGYYKPVYTVNDDFSFNKNNIITLFTNETSFIVRMDTGVAITPKVPINITLNRSEINVATFSDAALQKFGEFSFPVVLCVRSGEDSSSYDYNILAACLTIKKGILSIVAQMHNDNNKNFLTINSVNQIAIQPIGSVCVDGAFLY